MFSSWLSQFSCALQKANVACLRTASAGGRGPAPGASAERAGLGEGTGVAANALEELEDDWLAEAVEHLLQQARAAAEAEAELA